MTFPGFISSNDLRSNSSNGIKWQTLLPELLLLLIKASSPGCEAAVLTGNANSKPDWDGVVDSKIDSPLVPSGRSYWEFGTGEGARDKMLEDAKKRCEREVPELEQVNTPEKRKILFLKNPDKKKELEKLFDSKRIEGTLVLVCTGSSRKNQSFEDYMNFAERIWSGGVKKIFADDLFSHLQDFPAVHAWASYQFNGFVNEVRPPSEIIDAWERISHPPFPSQAMTFFEGWDGRKIELLARKSGPASAEGFSQKLTSSIKTNRVVCVNRKSDDTLMLVCKALLEDDDLSKRTIVIDTPQALLAFSRIAGKELILIPSFENPTIPSGDNRTVILVGGEVIRPVRQGSSVPYIEFIPGRLAWQDMHEFFMSLIIFTPSKGQKEASFPYYGDFGFSLAGISLFRRRHALNKSKPWSPPPGAPSQILGLLLVGSWDRTNDADLNFISQVMGGDIEIIFNWLELNAFTEIPGFNRKGDIWSVDPLLTEFALANHGFSSSMLNRWTEALIGCQETSELNYLSPSLLDASLQNLVRRVVLAEESSDILQTSIAKVREVLFDSQNSKLWHLFAAGNGHDYIFEAFPSETLFAIENAIDNDEMLPFDSSSALNLIGYLPENSKQVAQVASKRAIYFNPSEPDSSEVLSTVLSPAIPGHQLPIEESMTILETLVKTDKNRVRALAPSLLNDLSDLPVSPPALVSRSLINPQGQLEESKLKLQTYACFLIEQNLLSKMEIWQIIRYEDTFNSRDLLPNIIKRVEGLILDKSQVWTDRDLFELSCLYDKMLSWEEITKEEEDYHERLDKAITMLEEMDEEERSFTLENKVVTLEAYLEWPEAGRDSFRSGLSLGAVRKQLSHCKDLTEVVARDLLLDSPLDQTIHDQATSIWNDEDLKKNYLRIEEIDPNFMLAAVDILKDLKLDPQDLLRLLLRSFDVFYFDSDFDFRSNPRDVKLQEFLETINALSTQIVELDEASESAFQSFINILNRENFTLGDEKLLFDWHFIRLTGRFSSRLLAATFTERETFKTVIKEHFASFQRCCEERDALLHLCHVNDKALPFFSEVLSEEAFSQKQISFIKNMLGFGLGSSLAYLNEESMENIDRLYEVHCSDPLIREAFRLTIANRPVPFFDHYNSSNCSSVAKEYPRNLVTRSSLLGSDLRSGLRWYRSRSNL